MIVWNVFELRTARVAVGDMALDLFPFGRVEFSEIEGSQLVLGGVFEIAHQ